MLYGKNKRFEIEVDPSLVKVLIAEDDLPTRMLLRAAIQQWGYEVVEASDGEQAWEMLNNASPPVLLVIDWLMPKMDGIQLISRIKNQLPFYTYIILLTQVNGSTNAIKALEVGADEFLTKPFNMSELKIRVSVGAKILAYKNTVVEQRHQLQLCCIGSAMTWLSPHSNKLIGANFDTNRLRDIYGDDDESINHFIRIFIISTLKLLKDAENAIHKNDFDRAEHIFHSMKGSFSNSGAIIMYDLSVKAENAVKAHEWDLSLVFLHEIKSILYKLEQQYVAADHAEFHATGDKNKTILIVDDNIINLKLTRIVLKNSGFHVLTAVDGSQAMSILNEFDPALILMDLQLPDKDGLELTRIIKSNPKTKHIVVVALTANAMKGDEEKALSAGCDAYITKPFDTKLLPKKIADLLSK